MNAITLGNPNLYLKGIAETTFTDPSTGNIVGYDNVGSESAVTASVNLQEIAGGMANGLAGVLPDTVRLSGTYTSQAFSLETRRLITGGKLAYNAVAPVSETITASGASLTVSRTPAKHYGQAASDTNCWCYVREHGAATYAGTNYEVSPLTNTIVNFVAENGKQYDVYYFSANPSALGLEIPEVYNPVNVTVSVKFGVYAKQNNSVSGGTLQGWLYVVVPLAILNGDAGVSASQTANATTDMNWMAMSPDGTALFSTDCSSAAGALAYYIFVPCGDATNEVQALVVPGGGVSVAASETVQLPVKYLMPDDSLVQPSYTEMTYSSASTGVATVSSNGVVTGVSEGTSVITVTLTRADGTTLTTTAIATVTAA